MNIRLAKESDIESIASIEKTGPIVWGVSGLRSSFDDPNIILVAEEGGVVVGFVIGIMAAEELQIANIAVDPSRRRSGIATALIKALAAIAFDRGATACYLEVGAGNIAAKHLYQSIGFTNVGKRLKFYSDGEDAYTMFADIEHLAGSEIPTRKGLT